MDLVPEGQAVEASGPGMVHKREAGRGRGDELIPSFSQTALIVKPQTLSKGLRCVLASFAGILVRNGRRLTWFRWSGPPLLSPGLVLWFPPPSPTFLLLSGETSPLSGPRKARKFSEVS